MKITNDFYLRKSPAKAWTQNDDTIYITDSDGVTWHISSTPGGLRLRSLAGKPGDNDSIRIKPECANEIVLHSKRHED